MRGLISILLSVALVGCTHHDSASNSGFALTSFAALNASVISSKCVSCHSGTSPSGGMDFSTYDSLMKTGSVVAGNPAQSRFLTSVTSGSMPPGEKLSYDLVSSIESWIQNGARRDAALSIAKITPATAFTGQQVSVTITGEGLQSNCSVFFGGIAATSVIYNSTNQISVVSPILAPGTFDVKVTNPDGTSTTATGAFVVNASGSGTGLSVTKVFPNNGPSNTFIEIDGSGFVDGTKVTVGSQPCLGILVNPPNQITCTVPRNDQSGAVDVIVTNPDATTLPFLKGFSYTVSASFTSILNNILVPKCMGCHGATAPGGGIQLTTYAKIMQTGVVIPRDPANSTLYTDISSKKEPRNSTSLSANDVANVYNWILNGAYDDTPPSVTTIVPNLGSTLGGSAVTITGTGFRAGVTVSIGGSACTPATVDTTGKIINCVTSPRAAGTVDVVIINSPTAGITPLPSTNGSSLFIYVEPPTITAITPKTIKTSNTAMVTISGRNLKATSVYRFGLVNATSQGAPTCNAAGDCTVQVLPPTQSAGVVTVRVTNTDGQFFDAVDGLIYSTGDRPTLTSFSPTFTYTGRTPVMTINGTGFLSGASVTFGGKLCTNISVVSAVKITCTLASANLTVGPNALVVTNLDTLSTAQSFNLDFRQLLTIDTVTPASATLPVGGGALTVAGKGMKDGATMKLGATLCPNLQYNTDTANNVLSLTCITGPAPGLAAAAANIEIANPADENAEVIKATRNFNFVLPTTITISGVVPNSGPIAGGTSIVVTGNGFAVGTTVKIGGNVCTGPVVTATTITCTTPAATAVGAKDVVVTNTNNVTKTATAAFTYE